jgi:nucleotide-binding universal stress UspA family protein
MGRYKKILVAFDGSESSKNALRQAIALAGAEKSWIKALAVVPSYEGDLELVGVSDIENVLKGPVEKLVRSAEEVARAEMTNIITNIQQGEAYEKIVDVAEEENCDLIVMGRRGLRRLERMLMGSVTARVIVHSTKDVLIVPRGASVGWDNTLLATDGSAHSEAALDRALYFASSRGGTLTAVSVVDIYPEFFAEAPEVVEKMEKKSAEILEGAVRKARAAGVEMESVLLRGNPAEEIVGLAGQKEAGLIFMGSRGMSGLRKIVMGSVTEKVIGLTSCPVFVVKTPA